MNCPRGHGEMVEQRLTVCFCDRATPAKIVGAPGFVCETCGERFHRFSVARRIEAYKRRLDAPDYRVRMNVIQYHDEPEVDGHQATVTVLRPFGETTNTRMVPLGS
jgi:hypothetical protein